MRAEPLAEQCAGATILVVDDEPLVLRVLVNALRSLGYQALAAPDGATAVQTYRDARGAVSAVILDLIMPGLGARATFLALKAIDPAVRVLLTSGGSASDAQEILDLGAQQFIEKPFDIADLSRALAQLSGPAQG